MLRIWLQLTSFCWLGYKIPHWIQCISKLYTNDCFLSAAVGWIMALSSIAMVPLIAVIRFCLASGSVGEVSQWSFPVLHNLGNFGILKWLTFETKIERVFRYLNFYFKAPWQLKIYVKLYSAGYHYQFISDRSCANLPISPTLYITRKPKSG